MALSRILSQHFAGKVLGMIIYLIPLAQDARRAATPINDRTPQLA